MSPVLMVVVVVFAVVVVAALGGRGWHNGLRIDSNRPGRVLKKDKRLPFVTASNFNFFN